MIEQYFIKGTTFNWAAPAFIEPLARDGTIVPSGHALGAAPPMTYAGLDPEILYASSYKLASKNHLYWWPPSYYGLVAVGHNVPYVWVNYVKGRTAWVQPAGSDLLTGFMSGCLICTWDQGGARHVGHIGTVSDAAKNAHPNSTVKNTFSALFPAHPAIPTGTNLLGYNPASVWEIDEIQSVCKEATNWGPLSIGSRLMSLVTANDEFYTVLMIERSPNLWICGGKKQVPALDQAAVLLALA
jgi:hypothetical protein